MESEGGARVRVGLSRRGCRWAENVALNVRNEASGRGAGVWVSHLFGVCLSPVLLSLSLSHTQTCTHEDIHSSFPCFWFSPAATRSPSLPRFIALSFPPRSSKRPTGTMVYFPSNSVYVCSAGAVLHCIEAKRAEGGRNPRLQTPSFVPTPRPCSKPPRPQTQICTLLPCCRCAASEQQQQLAAPLLLYVALARTIERTACLGKLHAGLYRVTPDHRTACEKCQQRRAQKGRLNWVEMAHLKTK